MAGEIAEMNFCLICGRPVPDFKPERCCDGFMCGCQGAPMNPCLCSDTCATALFDVKGTFEERRIRHNIQLWQAPRRIKLRRVRGWRMPANTVKVDRTTPYGNPYQGGTDGAGDRGHLAALHKRYLARGAEGNLAVYPELLELIPRAKAALPGKNLACWCPLCPKHQDGRPYNEPCADCGPCHADNWLNLVNPEIPSGHGR
jgi:hypothetical protein